MLLNLTQHGRGDLDPEVIRICKDIGAWLKVNGEAVYASRPFEVAGDNSRFLHAQPGQGLCHSARLDRRAGNSHGAAHWRRYVGQSVQSRTGRLRRGVDICSKRSGASGDAKRTGAAAAGDRRSNHWQLASAFCASHTTKAGSTTTTRAWWLRDGHAAPTWAPATTTTTSPSAKRPAMCGVLRSPAAAFRSSRRRKREPEELKFKLTAEPAPRRMSPPAARAWPSSGCVKSPA